MADSPDLESLARDYMDLWQQHLNSISQDEGMADLMAQSLAQSLAVMTAGAGAFAKTAQEAQQSPQSATPAQPDPQTDHAETDAAEPQAANSARPQRAAPSAVSPQQPGPDVDQLLERIAALEKRVAELERQPVGKRESRVRARNRS